MANKSILYFIQNFIKSSQSVKDLLSKEKRIISENDIKEFDTIFKDIGGFNKSTKGFLYERLWDICIKFGITDFTDNKKYEEVYHGFGNINDIKTSSFNKFDGKYCGKYIATSYISGNSGGYSDITYYTVTNDNKTLNLISVKYFENEKSINSYDIQNLCTIIENRREEGYANINVILFVKNKKNLIDKIKKANKSSDILIKYISPYGNYENIYDEYDLERYYIKLKQLLELYNYLSPFSLNLFKKEYLKSSKELFIPRFHQELFINKINHLINKNNKKILLGAIPRSGKTYIMAGSILEYVKNYIENNKSSRNDCKFIIITPAPSETIPQYLDAFNQYIDFENNIKAIQINNDIEKYNFDKDEGKHFVYIISKQRLGYNKLNEKNDMIDNIDDEKLKQIERNIEKYFGNDIFDIIFLDEAHFGMSTKNAQTIINILDKNDIPKVFVTATYNKTNLAYNIREDQIIKWDINDIKMIKDAFIKKNYDINFKIIIKLLKRFNINFGKSIVTKVLKKYGWKGPIDGIITTNDNNKNIIMSIIKQYTNYPEPFLITSSWDKDFLDNQRQLIDGTNFSFDMNKLFLPKKGSKNIFENEEQLKEMLFYYFGYPNKDKKYKEQIFYKERGIMPRISNICNNNCRTLQSPSHKTSQLWFLPYGQGMAINIVINCLLHLLSKDFKHIFDKYMFFITIDKKIEEGFESKNVTYFNKSSKIGIKEQIINIEKNLHEYEGLIILAAGKLQLGISLANVDIVTLFTGITSSDAIYQMLFRSMTEIDKEIECNGNSFCSQKKYGFMVDLNPQRTLLTLNYLVDQLIDKTKTTDKTNLNTIITDLINIDRDVLNDRYDTDGINDRGVTKKFSDELFDKLYNAWDSKVEILKNIVKDIEYDIDIIKRIEDEIDIEKIFKLTKEKKSKEIIVEPEDEIKGKRILRLEDIYKHDKKDKSEKKLSIREMIDNIITEVISLLTILTSYNDFECILNKSSDIDKIDIKFQINKLIEEVEEKEVLKDIFISSLKDRIINNGTIDDEQLFIFIKNLINIISSMKKKGGSGLITIDKIILNRKKQIYSINEPDKLLEFIHQNLAPKEIEKKTSGEVFTPMKLVNEMLDTLPKDVWKNKDLKWLDPAAGIGNFPIAVYMRLMVSLEDVIKDKDERKKHIIENMIHMVELNKKNVFIMRKIFCGATYKLNVFEGSFLDYKADIKFDIIMGNPPFQNTNEEGERRALLNNLWSVFIDISFNKLLKVKGYLLFITPYSWMTPGFKYKDIFYDNYIIYLNIKECEKYFKGVGSSFSYYLIKKTNKKGNTNIICEYNNEIYKSKILINDINFLPILLTDKSLSIIKKFYNNKIPKISFKKSGELDSHFKKKLLGECNKKYFIYKIRHTSTHKNLCSKIKHSLSDKNKILLNKSGYLDPLYDDGKIGFTQNQMYLLTDNKKYVDVLNSNLYIFIFTICKWSGFNSELIFKNIPYIKQFKNDNDLYNLFKLSIDERNLINKIIKNDIFKDDLKTKSLSSPKKSKPIRRKSIGGFRSFKK